MNTIEKIKFEMQRQSITKVMLSQMTGIKQPNISAMLSGKRQPTLDTLEKVLSALKISF